MSEMDGVEVTNEILNIFGEERLIIIAITTDVFTGAEGLDDYMAKPLYGDDFKVGKADKSKKYRTSLLAK